MATKTKLPDPKVKPTLTITEAGEVLGLTRARSYAMAKSGYLPLINVNDHRWVVPTAELLKMLGLEA